MALVTKSFSDIITFTRASTATYFDSAGVLTSASNNIPRFDYDPVTLAARGLLIEEARTNSIRNNTMQGAVAGTPGTMPTNWGQNLSGISREVVSVGTQDGINYVDVRYYGTPTLGSSTLVFFESNSSVVAANGQTWTSSAWIAVIGGSFNDITIANLQIRFNNSGGSLLSGGSTSWLGATSNLNRYQIPLTASDATTAFVNAQLAISHVIGGSIDITLRIGLPQLELGAFATSVIPTTTTALTRSADVASVNTLSPWYSATEGTLYFEAQFYNAPNVAGSNIGALSDGTNSNRVTLGSATTFSGNINSNVSSGGVGQANPYVGSLSTVGPYKAAATYANNSFNIAVNGTLGVEDTSGVVPVGVDRLILGRAANGAGATNGWLRRTTYYPRKLSNAELQAITA